MSIDGRRVVVTGLGILAPNAHGVQDFENAIRQGKSGIRKFPKLTELNFRCQIGGAPTGVSDLLPQYFTEEDLLAMNENMIYGGIAAMDAWKDAGLEIPQRGGEVVHWDSGCVLGCGLSGIDTIADPLVPMINAGKVRRLGSAMVEQTMGSSISAKVSGLLALGNQVTSNSSACNTGSEAIHDSFQRIKAGLAEKMLAGGVDSSSPHVWGGFDAMRVLNGGSNDSPEKASRPMSRTAQGFVPGSGSGVLLLESLESAKARGARIYAEILSALVNCGGHRGGGSMTAPNCTSVQRCIQGAMKLANIGPGQIDAVNGHLTGTMADPLEVNNWSQALGRGPGKLPLINSTKSMIGHCLGAAGSIEAAAVVLQLYRGFVHGSLNCEDLHERIEPFAESVVHTTREIDLNIVAKASFGFGDVNSCIIYKKWS